MYESIKRNIDDFNLFIVAFDNLTYDILLNSRLDHITIISLKDFENQNLLDVKNSRTTAEYCWTCTSSVIDYVLENYNVPSCTYVDADLFFFRSPEILLNEMSDGKSVLITEHRFSKFAKLFEQKRAGRFCVQFITFTNDQKSRQILKKWISQCIEWCFARYEDGKFGDQKYLDEWPVDYPNVHILNHPGGGLAPWNVKQYNFEQNGAILNGIELKTGIKFDLVFFHFHFVKLMSDGFIDLGWNRLQHDVIGKLYKPYILKIIDKEISLEKSFPLYKISYLTETHQGIRESIKYHFKRLTKFNLIKL
jgi:hypothetical protein